MTAIVRGHAEAVKFLISKGADVTITTTDGNTALQLAEKGNNGEIIAALKEAGAKE